MKNIFKYSLYYTSRVFSAVIVKNITDINGNDYNSVQIFGVDNSIQGQPKLVAYPDQINKIFRQADVHDKPLKMVVVCGKPRLGKSTFCSLLYNNKNDLQSNGSHQATETNENSPLLGRIMKIFGTSRASFEPQTKGVWVTPRPIAVRDKQTGEIAFNVFVADVEGILGPNSEVPVHPQLFVLSTLMASHFVYYLRHPYDEYFHEVLIRYSTLGQSLKSQKAASFAEMIKNKNQKLIFLISNVKNQIEFKYGTESSDHYINELEKVLKINLRKFQNNFETVECFLMPVPGGKIRDQLLDDDDTDFDEKEVGEEYLKYLAQFRDEYFANKEGLKCSSGRTRMTGDKFADYIIKTFEQVNGGELAEIQSNLRVESTEKNTKEIEKLFQEYKNEMKGHFHQFVWNELTEESLIKINKIFTGQLMERFSSNPWSDWPGVDDTNFRKEFKNKLNNEFNDFLRNSKLYKVCLKNYTDRIVDFLKNSKFDDKAISQIKMEHQKFSESAQDYFVVNCTKSGPTSGYEFKERLDKDILNIYRTIEVNFLQLANAINQYTEELKKHFQDKPFHERWFNTKYSYIHADNQCLKDVHDELIKNISSDSKSYGLDFEKIFLDLTKDILGEEQSSADKWEYGIGIPGTVVGGLALGPFAVLGFPAWWAAQRYFLKPEQERDKLTKK